MERVVGERGGVARKTWIDSREKGMQDIAAPRDTRGRNLHDEAGDILQFSQSSDHEVIRFPYMNGPFSLACL